MDSAAINVPVHFIIFVPQPSAPIEAFIIFVPCLHCLLPRKIEINIFCLAKFHFVIPRNRE